MPLNNEDSRPGRIITVITKKRRDGSTPARTTRRIIENQQPGILGSGNRFVRDECRIFGDR